VRSSNSVVTAGVVPAIHVLFVRQVRNGCPAQGRA
jgi:hypothetical protein